MLRTCGYHGCSILFAAWMLGQSLAGEPAASSFTPTSKRDLRAIQDRIRTLLPAAKQATVAILGEGAGSGVIISPDGYVLTAAHVSGVPGKRLRVILSDGSDVEGIALGKVGLADAGMVKLQSGRYASLAMADNGDVSVGEWCLAIGHPGGCNPGRGPVARIGRMIWKNRNTMCTDCKLIGGDSGGPLINLHGEVIGIHSRISKRPDQNYHAPVAAFRRSWQELVAWQQVDDRPLGFLGVRVSEHQSGMLVMEVVPNSPAQKAAIRLGDLITHVRRQPINTHAALFNRMKQTRPRQALPLVIRRGNHTLPLVVKLGSRRPLS